LASISRRLAMSGPGSSDSVRRAGIGALVLCLVALPAMGLTGCKKKKKTQADPVSTALKVPGVRNVVIPKQRNSLTIVVPPCSEAAVTQPGARKAPAGSNTIVIPKGALTQMVAVPPCKSASKPPTANTVLVAPGGATPGQQSSSQQKQSQLVLPSNSSLTTVIVPPCTSGGSSSGGGSTQSGGSLATAGNKKTVTAPPCTVPKASSSSG
jgi:hypothetical protein